MSTLLDASSCGRLSTEDAGLSEIRLSLDRVLMDSARVIWFCVLGLARRLDFVDTARSCEKKKLPPWVLHHHKHTHTHADGGGMRVSNDWCTMAGVRRRRDSRAIESSVGWRTTHVVSVS